MLRCGVSYICGQTGLGEQNQQAARVPRGGPWLYLLSSVGMGAVRESKDETQDLSVKDLSLGRKVSAACPSRAWLLPGRELTI